MKHYDNSDLKSLLDKFRDHLTCWKVGLSFGSLSYFEMGQKWPAKLENGSVVEIGSATLVLESDEWTITWRGNRIADSESINDELANNLIWKYFVGKTLNSITYTEASKECRICFSEEGVTTGDVIINVTGESDEDMCKITFPDGTIIVCNAKNGFLSDDSRSDVHVAAYSSRSALAEEPKLHQVDISISSRGMVTVQTEVVTYPQKLMTMSRSLIDEGQFSLAIVVAHMACEIATERSLSEAFAAQGVQILEDWVRGSINGYNLANDRVRSLYTTLTGDNVQQQSAFWQKFRTSSKLRNKIIHGGTIATKADAEASYKAANDLVAHLEK
jgi:hypothetical protein